MIFFSVLHKSKSSICSVLHKSKSSICLTLFGFVGYVRLIYLFRELEAKKEDIPGILTITLVISRLFIELPLPVHLVLLQRAGSG